MITASSPIEPPTNPRWPGKAGVAPLRTTQRSRPCFTPCIVMVVMHPLRDVATDDPTDPLHDPFPAGIGIAPSQLHCSDVATADLAVLAHDRRRDVHAVPAARHLQVTGSTGVPQTAAAEMDADPDEA